MASHILGLLAGKQNNGIEKVDICQALLLIMVYYKYKSCVSFIWELNDQRQGWNLRLRLHIFDNTCYSAFHAILYSILLCIPHCSRFHSILDSTVFCIPCYSVFCFSAFRTILYSTVFQIPCHSIFHVFLHSILFQIPHSSRFPIYFFSLLFYSEGRNLNQEVLCCFACGMHR